MMLIGNEDFYIVNRMMQLLLSLYSQTLSVLCTVVLVLNQWVLRLFQLVDKLLVSQTRPVCMSLSGYDYNFAPSFLC